MGPARCWCARARDWYAKIGIDGRQANGRSDKREAGTRDGLTRSQAEASMRRLIAELAASPRVGERLTVDDAGGRYLVHLERLGRKRSTLGDYESYLRVHLAPVLRRSSTRQGGATPRGGLHRREVGRRRVRRSRSRNIGFLHLDLRLRRASEVVRSAIRASASSCPRPARTTQRSASSIEAELEALLRAVPDDVLGRIDRLLYLTAAMTGLRQGELVALRWRDVDWTARRDPRAPELRPRRVRAAEVEALVAPCRWPTGSRASSSATSRRSDFAGRRRPRLRPSGLRHPARRARGYASASSRTSRARGKRRSLPRPAPHLRHAHGRRRHAAADAAGVDGPPRLQDDADLRRLPAVGARSGVRRASV